MVPGMLCKSTGGSMNITYTPDSVSFTCANCGKELHLRKRSPETEISGTFCPQCDEHYYTRWDGILHRGKIVSEQDLIEQLADKEHARWAKWMLYLFSKCDVYDD